MLKLSKQELFDKAYVGVIKQGKPAYKIDEWDHVSCVYRKEDGLMCAVGHAMKGILKEDHSAWDSDMNASRLSDCGDPELHAFLTGDTGHFADEIQGVHDTLAEAYNEDMDGDKFVAAYKDRLESIANYHSLSVPALT